MSAAATVVDQEQPQERTPADLLLPPLAQTRILTLAAQGLSNSQISRMTGHDRATVKRVILASGFNILVEQARNRAAGMLDSAGDVLHWRLKAKRDPNVALALYRGTGVLVDKQEVSVKSVNAHVVMMATPPADWTDDYQARVIDTKPSTDESST